MSYPVMLPEERAIRPVNGSTLDGWSLIVNLDPSKDWSGSTFTVDGDAAFHVDQTHRGDEAPYVVVSLSVAALLAVSGQAVRWDLAEDVVLGVTFLRQRIVVAPR